MSCNISGEPETVIPQPTSNKTESIESQFGTLSFLGEGTDRHQLSRPQPQEASRSHDADSAQWAFSAKSIQMDSYLEMAAGYGHRASSNRFAADQSYSGAILQHPESSSNDLGLLNLVSEPSFGNPADSTAPAPKEPHEWYGKLSGGSSSAAPLSHGPVTGPWNNRPSLMTYAPQHSILHGLLDHKDQPHSTNPATVKFSTSNLVRQGEVQSACGMICSPFIKDCIPLHAFVHSLPLTGSAEQCIMGGR